MNVVKAFAGRSRCSQSQVAAIIVTPDNRHASSGYNGPPKGLNVAGPCDKWCPRGLDPGVRDGKNYGLSCLSVHAEVNALMRCNWKDMQGGTMYGTRTPCHDCVKIIANAGIARVVFPILGIDEGYKPGASVEFLQECGVNVDIYRYDPTEAAL